MITNYQPYPKEEIDFLREYYPTHGGKATLEAFNKHFGVNYTLSMIKHRVEKHNIRSNSDGKFKKNEKPWNTGIDYKNDRPDLYEKMMAGEEYRFKKGQMPANTLPIGTEKKTKDNYIVKIAMPNVWVSRARLSYELANACKLKDTDKILHLDGDKYNDSPDNLIKVSDAILGRLNKLGLLTKNKDINKCAVVQQMILHRIKEIENEEKNSSKKDSGC